MLGVYLLCCDVLLYTLSFIIYHDNVFNQTCYVLFLSISAKFLLIIIWIPGTVPWQAGSQKSAATGRIGGAGVVVF